MTPSSLRQQARTVATLAALTATLPVDLAVTGAALLTSRRRRPDAREVGEARTVLVSGGKMTKALALARAFDAAGHRVVLTESARYRWTGHRFSRAVAAFHVLPDPGHPDYAEALLDLVDAEGVDVFVPVSSPASSVPEADVARLLEGRCEVVHVDRDVIGRLDDKHEFARTAESLGLDVPETHRVTDAKEVEEFAWTPGRRYVLKNLAYDPVHRLDLTPLPRPTEAETSAFVRALPIDADHPWILQELVEGEEYCTHGTVRQGRLQAWACCASSPFQVNYAMLDEPAVRAWVETLVAALDLTGQVAFDFMRTPDGRLVAIECNPRTHSAVTLFHGHPGLAAAYLQDGRACIEPAADARPTYWTYHELWRALSEPRHALARLRVVLAGRDAIFDRHDPLPYLLVHHLQIPSLLVDNLRRGGRWTRIDFNIGKLVEPGGD